MLEAFDARFLESVREKTPQGRFAHPDEIAREICDKIGNPQGDDN
jgi:hypothetical protein